MSEILNYLQLAKVGDKDAVVKIIDHYMPTVISYSRYENPQVSEDCRQYIILNLVMAISRFKPMTHTHGEDNIP